ncbi:MAG: hypothetical protein AB7N71_07565, partial [Phycisphaerae bacterium]
MLISGSVAKKYLIAGVVIAASLSTSGCFVDSNIGAGFFSERSGQISFIFINNTRYRAIFSFGTYDPLDKSPGSILIQQNRVEAQTTTGFTALNCRRAAVVGTQELIERGLEADFDNGNNFDDEAFTAVVNFSSAPLGSTSEGLPTQGTAVGRTVVIGSEFDCRDRGSCTFGDDR